MPNTTIKIYDSQNFFKTEIGRNLFESCKDGNTPAWLDEKGRIVGIFSRIIDFFRYYFTGRSLIEKNFKTLCQSLACIDATNEQNDIISDIKNINKEQIINTILQISLKIPKIESTPDHATNIQKIFNKLEPNGNPSISLSTQSKENYHGLINLGNTCFANATIQFLLHLPIFDHLLQNDLKQKTNERDEIFLLRKTIQINLYQLKNILQSETINEETLKELLQVLWNSINFFSNEINSEIKLMSRQEDAHEFLLLLFNILQCDSDDLKNYHFNLGIKKEIIKTQQDAEEDKNYSITSDPVEIPIIAVGNSLDTIKQHYQEKNELQTSGIITIQQIIDDNFAMIPDDTGHTITFTKKNQEKVQRQIKNTREFLIAENTENIPAELFFHLCRFQNIHQKDTTPVDIGLIPKDKDRQTHNTSEITIYFHSSNEPYNRKYKTTYSLETLICHQGTTLLGGHYYTIRKTDTSQGKKIMYFSDTTFRTAKEADLPNIQREAYLVSYSLKNITEMPTDPTEATTS